MGMHVRSLSLPILIQSGLAPPQPEPISLHVYRGGCPSHPHTTISKVFTMGEGRDCRLCPRSLCNLDEHGHCCFEVPCHVPDELAATFPLHGDARLVADLLAARRDAMRDPGDPD